MRRMTINHKSIIFSLSFPSRDGLRLYLEPVCRVYLSLVCCARSADLLETSPVADNQWLPLLLTFCHSSLLCLCDQCNSFVVAFHLEGKGRVTNIAVAKYGVNLVIRRVAIRVPFKFHYVCLYWFRILRRRGGFSGHGKLHLCS